jgi:prepilin-type N-terminal cleavage/methylation domain-containing protein
MRHTQAHFARHAMPQHMAPYGRQKQVAEHPPNVMGWAAFPPIPESGLVLLNAHSMSPPPLNFARFPRARRAFTLTELLVVIVIIAIVAALLFPITGLVRSRADSTQCVSQLRQIGTAIAVYIGDNNGILPGPLTCKQSADYLPNQPGSLAALLENYLGTSGLRSPNGNSRYSPLFECPAAARKLNDPAKPTYLVDMLQSPDAGQSVWGDVTLDQKPLPNTALNNWSLAYTGGAPLSPSETWAIQDADQNYIAQVSGIYSGPVDDLLPTQAHEDHWNDLYFDFHVARRTSLIEIISPTKSAPAPSGSPGSP